MASVVTVGHGPCINKVVLLCGGQKSSCHGSTKWNRGAGG